MGAGFRSGLYRPGVIILIVIVSVCRAEAAGRLGLVCLFLSLGRPHFSAIPGSPNQRFCFANQKTIAGAVELYNLDFVGLLMMGIAILAVPWHGFLEDHTSNESLTSREHW